MIIKFKNAQSAIFSKEYGINRNLNKEFCQQSGNSVTARSYCLQSWIKRWHIKILDRDKRRVLSDIPQRVVSSVKKCLAMIGHVWVPCRKQFHAKRVKARFILLLLIYKVYFALLDVAFRFFSNAMV